MPYARRTPLSSSSLTTVSPPVCALDVLFGTDMNHAPFTLAGKHIRFSVSSLLIHSSVNSRRRCDDETQRRWTNIHRKQPRLRRAAFGTDHSLLPWFPGGFSFFFFFSTP